MAEYQNAEIRRGGDVVRVNVVVDVQVPLATGRAEWNGILRPPNNTGLINGEAYTLILPGFLPAKILVTSEAHAIDGAVQFQGIGDLTPRARAEQVR